MYIHIHIQKKDELCLLAKLYFQTDFLVLMLEMQICPLSEYAPAPIRIITSGEGEKLPESRDREDVISYPLT